MSNESLVHRPGTAVVTGASAGLGRLYADRLASRGHDLVLVARRADRLAELAAQLRSSYGVAVHTLPADLGQAWGVAVVSELLRSDDSITMLVNNAGTSKLAPVAETDVEAMKAMVNVNIVALAELSMTILPKFKRRNSGTLVNIGSVLGFHSLPVSTIYSGTKAFVLQFTRGLQDELAGTAVRVQLVMPAATATDIWELSGVPLSALDAGTIMTAEHCVDAALQGLDAGESLTFPSLDHLDLFVAYDNARLKLLGATQTSHRAARYEP